MNSTPGTPFWEYPPSCGRALAVARPGRALPAAHHLPRPANATPRLISPPPLVPLGSVAVFFSSPPTASPPPRSRHRSNARRRPTRFPFAGARRPSRAHRPPPIAQIARPPLALTCRAQPFVSPSPPVADAVASPITLATWNARAPAAAAIGAALGAGGGHGGRGSVAAKGSGDRRGARCPAGSEKGNSDGGAQRRRQAVAVVRVAALSTAPVVVLAVVTGGGHGGGCGRRRRR